MQPQQEQRRLTWEQADSEIRWLMGHLGAGFQERVDEADAVLWGPLSDYDRHLARSKFGELTCALASYFHRDRELPQQNLSAEEDRVLTLAVLARACGEHSVLGWQERIARIANADDRTYRSLHFEIETAGILARSSDHTVEFVPEDGPAKNCDLRIGGFIDVECKRLDGRRRQDQNSADFWRRLRDMLWQRVASLGNEYVFIVEVAGAPTNDDLAWLLQEARLQLSDDSEASGATDDDRVRFWFKRSPVRIVNGQLEGAGMPVEVLETFDFGRFEARAELDEDRRNLVDGVACTFAFKSGAELDLVKSAKRVIRKARRQLPKDRPSLVVVDAYEPILELPLEERAATREQIYAGLQADLADHGRPTGVILAAPDNDVGLGKRSMVYAGNPQPSAPFPAGFELFTGWAPA
ncbi:hypothetical protein [Glycomyces paridis]|uniref:Uncharacterized protein n=1 Tax=Glycomyces paridis TaxID=2126555 RepID=A0A4S8PF11_9ACTN|nr:hypothetical protein [Glycomyces paridis]THV28997.1 hypothetical protein E9998_09600 [Glycomyces paridis]